MRRRQLLLPLLVLAVTAVAGPYAPVPAVGAERRAAARATTAVRDWRVWPFSRRSPWNHPIGSAAQYAAVPRLTAFPIGINYEERWTASIAIATAGDPMATMLFSPNWGRHSTWTFLDRGGKNCGNSAATERSLLYYAAPGLPPTEGNYYSTISTPYDSRWLLPSSYHAASRDYRSAFHLPPGVCPSPDSDGLLAVFQPDGWVIDIYAAVRLSNGDVIGTMASWINVRGDGTGWWNGRRASMLPSFAGLIRAGEIAAGRIPHALAAQVPAQLLKEEAVWPAYAFDRDSGYSGSLPMGALLAIPPWVDIANLDLSPYGQTIARAAQDYGVYIVDRGGEGITILAELGDPDIRWDRAGSDPPWWKDLLIIRDHLQRVTNNGPTTRGGGGVPRAPLAPHLRRD